MIRGAATRARIALAVIAAPIVVAAGVPLPADAGEVDVVVAGANLRLPTQSVTERAFTAIIRQQYDFSCGSAALASLMTYHYGLEKTEEDVFLSMWEQGEQERIRERGFSLFDMRSYLQSIGLVADGFKLTLDKVAEIGVPGIALIDVKGYKHFVVVKGIHGDEVLIGDPSAGMMIKSRQEFLEIWDGTIFFIRSDVDVGRRNFNLERDWYAIAPTDFYAVRTYRDISRETLDNSRLLNSGFSMTTLR